MAIAIQINNNNKGDDTGITTGCGLKGLWTKSELDRSEQDIKEVETLGPWPMSRLGGDYTYEVECKLGWKHWVQ